MNCPFGIICSIDNAAGLSINLNGNCTGGILHLSGADFKGFSDRLKHAAAKLIVDNRRENHAENLRGMTRAVMNVGGSLVGNRLYSNGVNSARLGASCACDIIRSKLARPGLVLNREVSLYSRRIGECFGALAVLLELTVNKAVYTADKLIDDGGHSGDFAASSSLSVADQLAYGKGLVRPKYNGHSYIAYFQAYTNTYAPACHLRRIFTEAISDPEVRILSIATRPDCLSPEILTLLAELNAIKPVWVELGLQTIHERTANWMRRGYPLSVFEQAVHSLHAIGVQIITHVILFLPGESEADMLATIHYLNALPIDGIKLQLLHVLKHTDLADLYRQEPFYIPDMNAYFHLLGKCIASLRPDIVIHRLTGDGPKSLLIAPLWTGNKRLVLNQMQRYLKEQNLWQGKEYTTF